MARKVLMRSSWLLWTSLVSLSTVVRSAHAAEVPMGFVDQQVADGLQSPTALSALPDGRLLVVQQNGVIRTVKDDVMLPESYWEVPDVDSTYERGCLGIVPDPSFETNHYVYAYCSIKGESTSNNHVLRVTEVDGRADPGTVVHLLELPEIRVQFHMGGAMRFGLDGMLYVAVGNHEDGPIPESNSQILSNPFGKLLRIRPDGTIPDDNPFVGQPDVFPAIWSYGYRNPFAFDVQPGTGRTLVCDVGQADWEEINEDRRGANYGWSLVEGRSDDPRFEQPLYVYEHSNSYCSITGGAFYNPTNAQFPAEYVGTFLFEDFCAGTIEVLDLTTNQARPFASGIGYPTNLAVAPDGSIWYLSRNQDTMTHDPSVGTLSKIAYSGTAAPRISKNPLSQTIVLGDPVTFEVTVQDATTIQWQRDGVDIAGATGDKYTIAQTTAEDNAARFVAVAENAFGTTSSLAAELTVTTNRPPTAAIEGAARIEYAPGELVTLKGTATDAEDGALPASAFTWQVDYQHDTHTHPLLGAMSGSDSLTFMVPAFEAEEANTWVRVELFVKDSGGGMQRVYRDIYPRTQLSSLTPLDPVVNESGPIQLDQRADGKPLVIDGVGFDTGLGVQAPSDVRYLLDGRCSGKLVAAVGLDDEVAERGSVAFQVFVDDNMVYDSGVKRGSDGRENVVVDVAGAKQLRLVVTDGGDGNADDRADWGAARVMGCDFPQTKPAAPESKPEEKSEDKPAADGSQATPARSDAKDEAADEVKDEAKDDEEKAAPERSPSSRSDSASRGDAGADAASVPEAGGGGGCGVAHGRAAASPWLLLAMLGLAGWRRTRRRTQRACREVRGSW
jgi:MYXO-CTERM domain-containing protein